MDDRPVNDLPVTQPAEAAPVPERKNTAGKWICFVLAEVCLFVSIFFFTITIWSFQEVAELSEKINSGEVEEQVPGGLFLVMSNVGVAGVAGLFAIGCWCGAVFLGVFPLVRTKRTLKILAIVHMALTALALPLAFLLLPIIS